MGKFMKIFARPTCLREPRGSHMPIHPRRQPGTIKRFDRDPILMIGAKLAKETMGTNLLPPKAICA